MRLKNYQEDIVLNAVTIAIEESSQLNSDDQFLNDVAAFVLNRIPPMYIMSHRGFERLASRHLVDEDGREYDKNETLIDSVKLMLLVNQGIDVVNQRRVISGNGKKSAEALIGDFETGYIHNFPQFVGRILTKNSNEAVNGVKVTLFINGDIANPADPGWSNPSYTNIITGGYFSFWPQSVKSAEEKLSHTVKIKVEHELFKPEELIHTFMTIGVLEQNDTISGDSIYHLPSFYLNEMDKKQLEK
jgi:hypothetical protein